LAFVVRHGRSQIGKGRKGKRTIGDRIGWVGTLQYRDNQYILYSKQYILYSLFQISLIWVILNWREVAVVRSIPYPYLDYPVYPNRASLLPPTYSHKRT
jgi:hypothetical protein